jgi:DNA polymerase-3 subunit beta
MKVQVQQDELNRGLAIVGRAVSPRSTLPVLHNVMIQADNTHDGSDYLILSATNLEIGVRAWVKAKVEDLGSCTIPAKLLSEFVGALPAGDRVDLNLKAKIMILNLKCARYDTNIKGIDASEFPLIPTSDGADAIRIEADALRKMITRVVFAAAIDESRPTLRGVKVTFDGAKIEMAATDGFRLAVANAALEEPVDKKMEVIIPARSLNELGRIIGLLPADMNDTTHMVDIIVFSRGNQVMFRMPGVDLITQVIDANFPKYETIIPKSHVTSAVVDTKALLKGLRVSNLFARDSSHMVRFTINPAGEDNPGDLANMIITSTSAEAGDNIAGLEAVVTGPLGVIAFNGRYMLDVLSAIDDAQIKLEITRPSAPGVVRPYNDSSYLCVVMPMHDGNLPGNK